MKPLKKHIITLLFITVFVYSFAQNTIEVSGFIAQNEIWEVDTVKITGNVIVSEDACLSIAPGTYIEIQGFYSIDVEGSILAIGTVADSIYFSVADTTGFWPDTLSNAGGWDGIHFEGNHAAVSRFEYCNMAYGKQYYPWPDYPDYMGGGLLRVKNYGGIFINHCRINNNMMCHDYGVSWNYGGALFCQDTDTVNITNNTFFRNRSFQKGGAVSVLNGCPNTIISHNIFIENIAFYYYHGSGWITAGGLGGAIHCSDAEGFSPTITNNKCFNNRGGGIIYTSNLNSTIYNNVICNNGHSFFSGGTGILDGHNLSQSKIFNNLVINNSSPDGIGIFSKAKVYNNIVWGNSIVGEEIDDQIKISDMPLVDPILFNNCVEYGPGGIDSITAYPQFANPTQGAGIEYDGLAADWTLLNTSPCVNSGTPDTTGLNLPAFDIVGNPRIYGGRIDMGAYENQYVHIMENNTLVGSKIKLYPNPGTNRIYIDIPAEVEGAFIDIVDGQGKVLMHGQIRFSPSVLSPDKLKSGIYFYRIYKTGEVVKSGKWVKR